MNVSGRIPVAGLGFAMCVLAASCRTTPLAPPACGGARFAEPFPARFTAQQTVVMTFRPHWWWPPVRLTALGYASVDRATGDFAVVCLSPLGVKLFEATRRGGVDTVTMALPAKGDAEALRRAIGEDIASLYFGLAPPEGAVRRQGRRQVTIVAKSDGKRTEWCFDAGTGRLSLRTEWTGYGTRTVAFEDYEPASSPDRPLATPGPAGVVCDGESPATEYPARMTLRNSRLRYTLTVKQRLTD
jgi:hypothetical protein